MSPLQSMPIPPLSLSPYFPLLRPLLVRLPHPRFEIRLERHAYALASILPFLFFTACLSKFLAVVAYFPYTRALLTLSLIIKCNTPFLSFIHDSKVKTHSNPACLSSFAFATHSVKDASLQLGNREDRLLATSGLSQLPTVESFQFPSTADVTD